MNDALILIDDVIQWAEEQDVKTHDLEGELDDDND